MAMDVWMLSTVRAVRVTTPFHGTGHAPCESIRKPLGRQVGGLPRSTSLGEWLPGARPARYFSINYPNFTPDLPSHEEAPEIDHVALQPSLQSTLHNKAKSVNSATPTVICIVLNKQHWSHKCGCQYIRYNSAPYTHHKLQRWSASGNTTHTLLPHPLPHLAWRPSCFGQSKHEARHAPTVRG